MNDSLRYAVAACLQQRSGRSDCPSPRPAILLALLFLGAHTWTAHAEDPDERIPEGAIVLPEEVVDQFRQVRLDETLILENFPVTNRQEATVELTRRELYADGARIEFLASDDSGNTVQSFFEPSSRRFFRGSTTAGYESRLSFMLDDTGLLIGHSQVAEGVFIVAGVETGTDGSSRSTAPHILSETASHTTDLGSTPAGSRQEVLIDPPGIGLPGLGEVEPYECLVRSQEPLLVARSAHQADSKRSERVSSTIATSSSTDPATAVLAFDSDNTFLARKFADVPQLARNWIEDAVNQINTSLELDLGLRVLIGDIILRGGLDPYENTDQRATEAALNEFAQYWVSNQTLRQRTFAMLLSGNSAQVDYATGIAAVNSYCQESRGYAVTQVYVADVDVSNDARLILHEIGHMLGTHHTHCYSPEVDTCFNQEAGCHDGAVECPATGRGSAMSQCNISGCNRPNLNGFAPRVRSALSEIIQATPSCFAPKLFRDDFETGSTARWSN